MSSKRNVTSNGISISLLYVHFWSELHIPRQNSWKICDSKSSTTLSHSSGERAQWLWCSQKWHQPACWKASWISPWSSYCKRLRELSTLPRHTSCCKTRGAVFECLVCVLRKFRDSIIDCHNGRSLSPAWSLWQDSCTGSHQRMKTFPSDCQPSLRLLHWIAYLILMDGLCQAMFWWTLQQSGRAQWRIRSMRSSIRYHKDRGTYNFDLTWFEFPM